MYADLDLAASSPPQPAVVAADAEPTADAPRRAGDVDAGHGAGDDGHRPATPATPTPTTTPPTSTAVDAPAVGDADRRGRPSEVGEATADAFAHGWFSDDGAFVQVALWGLVLAAIGIGACLLSRRVRRNWVGALVGIVPFVVVLYFFFQNVNRLLPAAL